MARQSLFVEDQGFFCTQCAQVEAANIAAELLLAFGVFVLIVFFAAAVAANGGFNRTP